MFQTFYIIKDWFGEAYERYKLIRDFNKAAKAAFIAGDAPTILQAKITMGDSNFKHEFSKWLSSGFRIKALSGKELTKEDLLEIGNVILENKELTRKLITLGWDTLEVHSFLGSIGLKWELKKYAQITFLPPAK